MVLTRVVAINGSARMEKGNTARVLAPFLDGMREAGASVELLYPRKLNIKPCTGELHCWHKDPGVCYIKDDMQLLYPKLREADVLVLATPVYMPLPGETQNLINRMVSLIEPVLSKRKDRTRAGLHENVKIGKVVLISTCGWWELGNFGSVVQIAEELAKNFNVDFVGPVLRPHAYLLAQDNEEAKAIKAALKRAGHELIEKGAISKTLLRSISQPLISESEYTRLLNKDYEQLKMGHK